MSNQTGADKSQELDRTFDLVHRAQRGDQDALGRLFDRYYERVRKIVRMRLRSDLRSMLDSSDILQETFAQAVKGFDKFELRDKASVINWLSKIAQHKIFEGVDYHSAKKRDARQQVTRWTRTRR